MKLIDTHVHLYSEEYKDDLDAVIENAKRNGVVKVYLPAVDNESHEQLLKLADTDSDFFRPMMGVHPCNIKENYQEELAIAEKYLHSRNDWSAIGEIGLDYYWETTFQKEQHEAFHTQIAWAIKHNLPVVIHSRNATNDTIDVLTQYKGKVRGIFHCFGGSVEEAKAITDLDFLLGIGGIVTFKNSGLKKVLPEIGLQHLVLETDAPWLAPTPYRGKRNEPAHTRLVADEIANILGVSTLEVANVTTENALKLFK